MKKFFEILFTNEAKEFLHSLDEKILNKFLKTIEICQTEKDSSKFKKLDDEVWEFRVLNKKNHYRILAVWNKKNKSLVLCTHGIIKKNSRVPLKEIKKAKAIGHRFFS